MRLAPGVAPKAPLTGDPSAVNRAEPGSAYPGGGPSPSGICSLGDYEASGFCPALRRVRTASPATQRARWMVGRDLVTVPALPSSLTRDPAGEMADLLPAEPDLSRLEDQARPLDLERLALLMELEQILAHADLSDGQSDGWIIDDFRRQPEHLRLPLLLRRGPVGSSFLSSSHNTHGSKPFDPKANLSNYGSSRHSPCSPDRNSPSQRPREPPESVTTWPRDDHPGQHCSH